MRRRRRRRSPLGGVVVLVALLVVGGLTVTQHLDGVDLGSALGSSGSGAQGAESTAAPTAGQVTRAAPAATTGAAAPGTSSRALVPASAARSTLASLPVRPWATAAGYDRVGDFGEAWEDVDHNGCDTRNDVLARDLTGVRRAADCKVLSGAFTSPYSGARIDFLKGERTSPLVQIDHVVALSDAWRTGAQQLSEAQRILLANDPLELLAVDGASNDSKGSQDAASWLPANAGYRCAYVTRQVQVKAKYHLWVTGAERSALSRVLASCP